MQVILLIISFLLFMNGMPMWGLLILCAVPFVDNPINSNRITGGGNNDINLDWVQKSENCDCEKVNTHHKEFLYDGDRR